MHEEHLILTDNWTDYEDDSTFFQFYVNDSKLIQYLKKESHIATEGWYISIEIPNYYYDHELRIDKAAMNITFYPVDESTDYYSYNIPNKLIDKIAQYSKPYI